MSFLIFSSSHFSFLFSSSHFSSSLHLFSSFSLLFFISLFYFSAPKPANGSHPVLKPVRTSIFLSSCFFSMIFSAHFLCCFSCGSICDFFLLLSFCSFSLDLFLPLSHSLCLCLSLIVSLSPPPLCPSLFSSLSLPLSLSLLDRPCLRHARCSSSGETVNIRHRWVQNKRQILWFSRR